MRIAFALILLCGSSVPSLANGHGPVFGAATPTLGRGAWSLDQAWTMRFGDQSTREQMLKTMVTFGITEIVQASVSLPVVMSDNRFAPARMMSSMSNDRELEGLVGYRFQRTPVGIGGRRESTLYVGGTIPFERNRLGVAAGGSLIVAAATGYAGRAHYVWVGGAIQHYFERAGDRLGDSRTLTAVYGYRPKVFRAEHDRPDLRFFIESTFEDRQGSQSTLARPAPPPRTLFVGPTTLLVYKAIAASGGIQWAAYQQDAVGAKERMRVAVNFSYFWFR
ncbi:MAG TPA: hypothetical protein VNT81_01180 [Vicinamibacterales bacterium]|nr:hypothetical protein [Vicinamibacterales bacterium]